MMMFSQPSKEPTKGDKVAVDRRHGLTAISSQMISKISDISGGDPTNYERFAIRHIEPLGELFDILGECAPRMVRQIMGGKELAKEGRFASPDRNTVENIITAILHALIPQI
jgi:hypothetical protein